MLPVKTKKGNLGLGIIFLLYILLIGLLISLIVVFIHETTLKGEYKSEFLLLTDVQYLDKGKVLYRFGDQIIEDTLISNNFNINEVYEVIYKQYKNSWGAYENEVWKYYEIRVVKDEK